MSKNAASYCSCYSRQDAIHSTTSGTAASGIHYYPGYFRVVTNDLYRGQAVADFAYNELGLRRMGAVHDGDPYTTALVSAFDNAYRTLGGEAVTVGIAKGDTDTTAVLAEFAAAGAEGLFVPLFPCGRLALRPAGAGIRRVGRCGAHHGLGHARTGIPRLAAVGRHVLRGAGAGPRFGGERRPAPRRCPICRRTPSKG